MIDYTAITHCPLCNDPLRGIPVRNTSHSNGNFGCKRSRKVGLDPQPEFICNLFFGIESDIIALNFILNIDDYRIKYTVKQSKKNTNEVLISSRSNATATQHIFKVSFLTIDEFASWSRSAIQSLLFL